MARPKSVEKRNAIMKAAIRIIAAKGLSAPTAMIAKEAGVSNGALFTYFETKSDLLNQLYTELKADMAKAMATDIPVDADMRDQVCHVWNGCLHWSMVHPKERQTLVHLGASNDVTEASRRASGEAYSDVEALLDRSRSGGALRDVPLGFVASLFTGIADATVDHMTDESAHPEVHAAAGFEALWRVLA